MSQPGGCFEKINIVQKQLQLWSFVQQQLQSGQPNDVFVCTGNLGSGQADKGFGINS